LSENHKMSSSRYYIESFHKGENELTGSEAHHLTTVMRARPGISVEVFDGKGSLGNAVVVNISKRSVSQPSHNCIDIL
jgi:16S rRNA U1498 N3-methylase RsmE